MLSKYNKITGRSSTLLTITAIMVLSMIFSSSLLPANTVFADSGITAESSSSVSFEDPNKDAYKLDDNYALDKKNYDELVKEANKLFPPGKYYNDEEMLGWYGDIVSPYTGFFVTERPEDIDENRESYGWIIYGKGYDIPFPPIINYKNTKTTSVGKIQYFKDGAITLVNIDQTKRQGGAIEVELYTRPIKTDNRGTSGKTLVEYYIGREKADSAGESWPIHEFDNSDCPYSDVYEGATGNLKQMIDYEFYSNPWDENEDPEDAMYFRTPLKPTIEPLRLNWYNLSNDKSLFVDVPDDYWAKWSINKCRELGLIGAIEGNKFAPEREVTRAEVVQVLYNTLWLDKQKNSASVIDKINDVNKDDWYAKSIDWAVVKAIAKIDENGNFNPNQPATREFIFNCIYKMAKNLNIGLMDRSTNREDPVSFYHAENDLERIKTLKIVEVMVKAKISDSYGDVFHLQDHITRAELAKIIDNYIYAVSEVRTGYAAPQKIK